MAGVRRGVVAAVAVLAVGCSATGPVRGRAALPGAKVGGTLVVGITAPGSIDPSNAYEPAGNLVISTMCEPLIPFDPSTGQPRPGLVSSWQIANSGARITLQLRKGAHFSDGKPVRAEDVAYSLARVASLETASFVAPLLQSVKGYDTVHGDKQTNSSTKRAQLSGIKVISSSSIEIDLTADDADYVRLLGHPLTSPVPRGAPDKDPEAFARNPVCAGPYHLDHPYRPGDPSISLSRSVHYTPDISAHTRGGSGYADHIVFKIYADAAGVLKAYRDGEVDVTAVDEGSAHDADAVVAPSGSVEYVGLPDGLQGSPFGNPAVRIALSQGLDRTKLIAAAFAGARVPATGFVPPSLGTAFTPAACGASTPPAADLEAARAALTRANVTLTGKQLKFYFNDDGTHKAFADELAAEWQTAFGLTVVPVAVPWDKYLVTATRAPGFDGAYREGWVAPYPSADAYLYPLLDSAGIGTDNWARFSSGALDLFLGRSARRATVDGDRAADYHRAEQLACQQMPIIPVAFGQTHYLVRRATLSSATGSFTDVATGGLDLREVYLR